MCDDRPVNHIIILSIDKNEEGVIADFQSSYNIEANRLSFQKNSSWGSLYVFFFPMWRYIFWSVQINFGSRID